MKKVIVSGAFDNLSSRDMRFLEEASKLGELHLLLWSDEAVQAITGKAPKFPLAEREYFVQALRYLAGLHVSHVNLNANELPEIEGLHPDVWAVEQRDDNAAKAAFARSKGIEYHVISEAECAGYPAPSGQSLTPGAKKVIVTGCYDWFHTGHVRFFEEVSELGDLHVVVGHDENIRLLKGEGHPMFNELERRYIAGSLRYVKQAFISSGNGWMDAEPEIALIKPDIYAVNEDGDKPEKREFCQKHGLEYVVLKRTPKPGLTKRSSTDLRGF